MKEMQVFIYPCDVWNKVLPGFSIGLLETNILDAKVNKNKAQYERFKS